MAAKRNGTSRTNVAEQSFAGPYNYPTPEKITAIFGVDVSWYTAWEKLWGRFEIEVGFWQVDSMVELTEVGIGLVAIYPKELGVFFTLNSGAQQYLGTVISSKKGGRMKWYLGGPVKKDRAKTRWLLWKPKPKNFNVYYSPEDPKGF